MKPLPDLLRRLPYVFYGLGALVFAWQLANQWMSMSPLTEYADDTAVIFGKSIALYTALVEAAYMVANGAIIHLLIAIHDKVRGE
jgi:hypothetical protein